MPGTGVNWGGVGLLEMRNARSRPDGTLEATAALRRQRRFYALSFQALPWLEATYRLAERLDGTTGRGITNDRSFDVKIRLWDEAEWRPALAVGLQDFIGTGLYQGEYLVASKRFGALDATLGIGWGRLGTAASFDNPLEILSPRFATRPREVGAGGTINGFPFFRGDSAALFGGLEWSLPPLWTPLGTVEGLRAKVEYSGDALRDERGGWPARTTGLRGEAASPVNAGLQWSDGTWDAGVQVLHGTDLLLRLSARIDPAAPPLPGPPGPPPMRPRPAAAPEAPEEAAAAALRRAGFRPEAVEIRGAEARIALAGGRQRTLAEAANRALRAVQPHLPGEVERIALSWRQGGAEVARLLLPRAAVEAAARGDGSAEEAFHAARLLPAGADAFGRMGGGTGLSWGIEPRIGTLFGDPARTLRWQLQAVAGARADLGGGVALAGSLARTLAGNLRDAPSSDSLLPRVRSDAARYAREGETSVPALYAEAIRALPAPAFLPPGDLFGRVSAGWLEPMFAGVSAEVLWRPHDRPFALGLEVAQVVQRDYGFGLGTLGYHVTTGHASVYADLPFHGMYAVARGGRYLAGDWGATVELGRRFASGIEVGAFATITDVPARTFGEGSFDRGIYVRLPLDLFGIATRAAPVATIRGVQRDGGQRLAVDTPLWELTREGRARALEDGFLGFVR